MNEPRTFPCMDDQPTNTGWSERDWDEIRTPRYPEDEEIEKEESEIIFWSTLDGEVVGNNNGQFNCQSTPLP